MDGELTFVAWQLGQSHKTIFTIQDEPPTWPSDSDEYMGLESMSEPDDLDLDEPQDGADEPFFDAQHDRHSSSTSPDTSDKGGTKSSEFDTEDDPMGPITPGPNSRMTFDIKHSDVKEHVDEFDEDDEDEDDDEDDDDDDDDWVDPSMPTPVEKPYHIRAPAMVHTKSNGSTSSAGSETKSKSQGKKSGKKKPEVSQPPAHFPFPSSIEDTPQHQRDQPPETPEHGIKQRMHTARARDGGRTQSGGVKGVLTAEDGENF
jgi:cysteine protease ATG4